MLLNDEDITIIKRTWEIPRSSMADSGVTILTKYFETYPDHMKKFEKFKNQTLDELKGTEKFKNHSMKIMDVFDKSVNALSTANPTMVLTEIWSEVGSSHFRKKIPKSYFNDLKVVIFEILGPMCSMNDRDAAAWGKFFDMAYNVVFTQMDKDAKQ